MLHVYPWLRSRSTVVPRVTRGHARCYRLSHVGPLGYYCTRRRARVRPLATVAPVLPLGYHLRGVVAVQNCTTTITKELKSNPPPSSVHHDIISIITLHITRARSDNILDTELLEKYVKTSLFKICTPSKYWRAPRSFSESFVTCYVQKV